MKEFSRIADALFTENKGIVVFGQPLVHFVRSSVTEEANAIEKLKAILEKEETLISYMNLLKKADQKSFEQEMRFGTATITMQNDRLGRRAANFWRWQKNLKSV